MLALMMCSREDSFLNSKFGKHLACQLKHAAKLNLIKHSYVFCHRHLIFKYSYKSFREQFIRFKQIPSPSSWWNREKKEGGRRGGIETGLHDGIASAVQHLMQVRVSGEGSLWNTLGYYGIQANVCLTEKEQNEVGEGRKKTKTQTLTSLASSTRM